MKLVPDITLLTPGQNLNNCFIHSSPRQALAFKFFNLYNIRQGPFSRVWKIENSTISKMFDEGNIFGF